jgi:hypothetical protein
MRKRGLKHRHITLLILPLLISALTGFTVQEKPPVSAEDIQIPPPPFTEGIYPCMECHADLETNSNRRELEYFHDDITLKHDEENRWCMDCHDAENRNKLHSAGDEMIDFTESYKLCGQCHGPKLRDWKAGIHGRRTGFWNGQKEYLLCAHCHDPHTPKFKKMKLKPPPLKPGKIK